MFTNIQTDPKTNIDAIATKENLIATKLSMLPTNEQEVKGYGACAASGCFCQAFEGNGQTCSNCGHAYSRHW